MVVYEIIFLKTQFEYYFRIYNHCLTMCGPVRNKYRLFQQSLREKFLKENFQCWGQGYFEVSYLIWCQKNYTLPSLSDLTSSEYLEVDFWPHLLLLSQCFPIQIISFAEINELVSVLKIFMWNELKKWSHQFVLCPKFSLVPLEKTENVDID